MKVVLFNCFKNAKVSQVMNYSKLHSLCFVTISLCSEKRRTNAFIQILYLFFCFFVCSKKMFYVQEKKISTSKLGCYPLILSSKQSFCCDSFFIKVFFTVKDISYCLNCLLLSTFFDAKTLIWLLVQVVKSWPAKQRCGTFHVPCRTSTRSWRCLLYRWINIQKKYI